VYEPAAAPESNRPDSRCESREEDDAAAALSALKRGRCFTKDAEQVKIPRTASQSSIGSSNTSADASGASQEHSQPAPPRPASRNSSASVSCRRRLAFVARTCPRTGGALALCPEPKAVQARGLIVPCRAVPCRAMPCRAVLNSPRPRSFFAFAQDSAFEESAERATTATETSGDAETPWRGPTSTSRGRKNSLIWTEQQDTVLVGAVRKYNGKNWKAVAELVGLNRSNIQCKHRWQKVRFYGRPCPVRCATYVPWAAAAKGDETRLSSVRARNRSRVPSTAAALRCVPRRSLTPTSSKARGRRRKTA